MGDEIANLFSIKTNAAHARVKTRVIELATADGQNPIHDLLLPLRKMLLEPVFEKIGDSVWEA
jgi:hypothetical protein